MKFTELLGLVNKLPLFETSLLISGNVNPNEIRRQLSRWVSDGRILQIRRGLYALAAPYARFHPHPFLVANQLDPGSYVSMESALGYHGCIPEAVASITSVTAGRPQRWTTAFGEFRFRHLAGNLLFGYGRIELPHGQHAFIASPDKALLDLIHLTPGGDTANYLSGLRLQNLKAFDMERMQLIATRSGKPKWRRAASRFTEWKASATEEGEG